MNIFNLSSLDIEKIERSLSNGVYGDKKIIKSEENNLIVLITSIPTGVHAEILSSNVKFSGDNYKGRPYCEKQSNGAKSVEELINIISKEFEDKNFVKSFSKYSEQIKREIEYIQSV